MFETLRNMVITADYDCTTKRILLEIIDFCEHCYYLGFQSKDESGN